MAQVGANQDQHGLLRQLGKVVRTRRENAKMSQEALADAAGIERSHMGKIERGERNITLLILKRIAAALNASPSELLREAGQ